MTVDVERAHTADALTAVVVEHERLLAFFYQLLVENIKHFEERCITGDIFHLKGIKMTLCLRTVLTPNFKCETYIFVHNCMFCGCLLILVVTCLNLNSLILKRFLDKFRCLGVVALILPATYVEVVFIVALSLAVLSLILLTEVSAARLVA